MKNLLVDALRQANADPGTDSPIKTPQAEGDEIPAVMADNAAVAQELDLIESVVLQYADQPATLTDEIASSGNDTAPQADADFSAENDAQFLPVLSEQTISELSLAEAPRLHKVNWSDATRVQLKCHWFERIGVWSPAIALLTLAAATGAYGFYQHVAVQNLNFDLDALSARIGTGVTHETLATEWPEFPVNNVLVDAGGFVQLETIAAATRNDSTPSLKAAPMPSATYQAVPVIKPTGSGTVVDDDAFEEVQSGFEAYQAGDYARAEKHYRHAIAINANHRHALAGLAAVLQKSAAPGEWLPIYETLLTLNPKDTVAAAVLLAHNVTGNPLQKATRLKVLLQSHPDVPDLHLALGLLAGDGGRWAEARLAFIKAHRLAPGNASYSFNAAVSMEHLGQYEQARTYYKIASASAGQSALVDRDMISDQIRKLAEHPGDSS